MIDQADFSLCTKKKQMLIFVEGLHLESSIFWVKSEVKFYTGITYLSQTSAFQGIFFGLNVQQVFERKEGGKKNKSWFLRMQALNFFPVKNNDTRLEEESLTGRLRSKC